MIYTVTLNPALDKTVEIPDFSLDSVNRIVSVRSDPGGKGINVSKVIQKLGGKSVAMGILGGTAGRALQEALDMLELKSDFLFVDGETRTNMKIIDPVNHTNTDLNEPGPAVSEEVLRKLLDRLLARLKKGDITVISGSLPKGAEKDTYYQGAQSGPHRRCHAPHSRRGRQHCRSGSGSAAGRAGAAQARVLQRGDIRPA